MDRDTIFEHWAHDQMDTYWSSLLLYCCDTRLSKSSSWEGKVSAYSLWHVFRYHRGAEPFCCCVLGAMQAVVLLPTLASYSCSSCHRAGITSLNQHTWPWSQITELTVGKERAG